MSVSLNVPSLKVRRTSYGAKKVYKVYKAIKVNVPARFVKVTFGGKDFDVPQIAIALLIVGVIIGLSGLILSIFATATAGAIANPAPGTLAYNMTHPLVDGMVSFFSFFPTLYILLGVTGIVLIAAGIIGIIMEKFKTS
ncbi:MAG: hypothetical protein RXR08_11045 [Sulfolobaceae archaeon]